MMNGEPVYCVIEGQNHIDTSSGGYKWKMKSMTFNESELRERYKIYLAPSPINMHKYCESRCESTLSAKDDIRHKLNDCDV